MTYLIGFFNIFPSQTQYVEVQAKDEETAIQRAWELSNVASRDAFIVAYVEELPHV